MPRERRVASRDGAVRLAVDDGTPRARARQAAACGGRRRGGASTDGAPRPTTRPQRPSTRTCARSSRRPVPRSWCRATIPATRTRCTSTTLCSWAPGRRAPAAGEGGTPGRAGRDRRLRLPRPTFRSPPSSRIRRRRRAATPSGSTRGRCSSASATGRTRRPSALSRTRSPGWTSIAFDLPHWNGRGEVMHLMSFISPLDRDLALVYPRIAPVRLLDLLAERAVEVVEVPDEEFETQGPNVLALGPRQALALDGNPRPVAGWSVPASTSPSIVARRSRGRATVARPASRVRCFGPRTARSPRRLEHRPTLRLSRLSWRYGDRLDTPTPTSRSAPGRSRRPRSRRPHATSPITPASSTAAGSVVERVRIEKSE